MVIELALLGAVVVFVWVKTEHTAGPTAKQFLGDDRTEIGWSAPIRLGQD